jgi:formylglycine-generating enzyme required for sulfatase activity
MDYEDFVIQLGTDAGAPTVRVARSSAGSSDPEPLLLHLSDAEIVGLATGFARSAAASRQGRDLTPPEVTEPSLADIGARLFRALFPETVRDRYQQSLGRAAVNSRGLRLRIEVSLNSAGLARLHAIPWEYLAADGHFLALSREISIVRHLSLGLPEDRPLGVAPLSILILAGESLTGSGIDLERELLEIVRAWSLPGDVRIKVLPECTLDALREELLAQEYWALHFMGHGSFSTITEEGNLAFLNKDGQRIWVSGVELADHLRDRRSLRLVFLNACKTGQVGARAPYAGVATALADAGIPAVLAMQFPISDAAALTLSRTFYRRIARGDSMDAAVAEGRIAIRGLARNHTEWGTPVLFERLTNGQAGAPLNRQLASPGWPSYVRVRWIGRVVAVLAVILLTWLIFLYISKGKLTRKLVHPKEPIAGTPMSGPLGMRMRYVPSGTYTIGSPEGEAGRVPDETRHEVRLTRGFWLAETELTQGQWSQVMPRNPSELAACGADCPVNNVNWYEAVEFANRTSDQEGLARCYQLASCTTTSSGHYTCESATFTGLDCPGYRLPTEAEWEIAARAGKKTAIYTGDLTVQGLKNAPELDPIAWYGGNSRANYPGADDCSTWLERQSTAQHCGPHPVSQKQANAWGFMDMLGNAWEWTGDWYGDYPMHLVQDPTGPPTGRSRVFRGGSWSSLALQARAAYRYRRDLPSFCGKDLGLRLVTCSHYPNNQRRGPCAAPSPL